MFIKKDDVKKDPFLWKKKKNNHFKVKSTRQKLMKFLKY